MEHSGGMDVEKKRIIPELYREWNPGRPALSHSLNYNNIVGLDVGIRMTLKIYRIRKVGCARVN
jgi:hypothetical protein